MMVQLNGCIFLIEDDDLLKKYNNICKKLNSMKKEFDSKIICNKKVLKIKIKSDNDEAEDFHNKNIPKVGSDCTCLAVILIDFVVRKRWTLLSTNVFLKKCK